MRSYKADKNSSYREFDHHNQAVSVASYVEHIMLIADIIRCRKIHFNILKITPLSINCYIIPSLQSYTGVLPARSLIKIL